ncbi:MAG: M15 family metallopeptidase [Pseudomonadota bacterium]
MQQWPTQAAVLAGTSIFGNPRNRKDPARASAAWESANLTTITPPFRMTYAGKAVRVIRVHKACAASLLRVLQNLLTAATRINPKNPQAVLDEAGVSIFGGVVMYRLMRGGSSLSIHSYGAAIDLDPARNGLYDQTPNFAKYPWVLAAFAAEGWRWGGDWDGDGSSADERKADGMHWQATA